MRSETSDRKNKPTSLFTMPTGWRHGKSTFTVTHPIRVYEHLASVSPPASQANRAKPRIFALVDEVQNVLYACKARRRFRPEARAIWLSAEQSGAHAHGLVVLSRLPWGPRKRRRKDMFPIRKHLRDLSRVLRSTVPSQVTVYPSAPREATDSLEENE